MKDFGISLYEALINSTDDFIYFHDCTTGVFHYPKALVDLLPLPGREIREPLPYWHQIIHPEDWDRFYHSNLEVVNNRSDDHLVEFRAKTRRGEYVWLRCRGHVIRDEAGEQLLFAGFMSLMGKQNKIDYLTQLLNHNEFYTTLGQNVQKTEIQQMAVVMVDVDEFRQVNELYNRNFGDKVLKDLGQIILSILPDNASLFRLEKDKMGVLMTNASCADVSQFYRTLQDSLLRIRVWDGRRLDLEVSAGCAMYPKDGRSAEELYRYTDYALQAAKQQGKNHLAFFNEDIFREKMVSLELLWQLKESVKQDYRGFYLNYQPQIEPKTQRMKGVEVLLRWKNPQGKDVSPGQFIPVMESCGLIYPVGMWVLRTAFREGRQWITRDPAFTISVNVSALQFLEEKFLPDLYALIDQEQFPRENLIIELTESFAFKNIAILQEMFHHMRSRGIRIALDDFGTGYCSLAALKDTPVDLVKIDRTFVKDMLFNKFDVTFIQLVTEICHAVSIGVCLEGVERQEEFEFIRRVDLDSIQGFYFGRPTSRDAITQLLETQEKEPTCR